MHVNCGRFHVPTGRNYVLGGRFFPKLSIEKERHKAGIPLENLGLKFQALLQ